MLDLSRSGLCGKGLAYSKAESHLCDECLMYAMKVCMGVYDMMKVRFMW